MPKHKPAASRLPDSAALLRALVRALNVSLPRRRRESVRKYLAGSRPRSVGMIDEVARAVVEAGYTSTLAKDIDPVGMLTAALSYAAIEWDHFVGHAAAVLLAQNQTQTVTRFARLASIEFAIRAAAYDVATDAPAAPEPLRHDSPAPTWATVGGLRSKVRALPRALRTTRGTITSSKRCFDDLFDGRSRPSLPKLRSLAAAVAKLDSTGVSGEAWRLHLLWGYALNALCAELAAAVGRSAVVEIASAFQRVRENTRRILLDNQRSAWADYRSTLHWLIVRGARMPGFEPVIDQLVQAEANVAEVLRVVTSTRSSHAEEEALSSLQASERARWAMDVRACHVPWVYAAISAFAVPPTIPHEGIPAELVPRILRAQLPGAAPHELIDVCREHPAAERWMVLTAIQQSFVLGHFDIVCPMIARLAAMLREPQLYVEAAIAHAAAGKVEDALRFLDSVGTVEPFAMAAKSVSALLHALSGQPVDALLRLDALQEHDQASNYARGVALRAVGRAAEALQLFESILAETPDLAPALEQAALCCDSIAAISTGKERARWSRNGNRYARLAAKRGSQVATTGRGTRRRETGTR